MIYFLADQKGKWWVVGSAWSGHTESREKKDTVKADKFSQKLLDLARKQRMNTDSRRDIFCIIMSAEVDDLTRKNLLLNNLN